MLVVDDEPRALQLAAMVLQSGRIDCVTAGSAEEALSLLRASAAIDVVLSDIVMPGVGGLEFLAQVRAEFIDRPWLQLLLITGQASVETAVAAMKLDASDYLLKPVDPKNLREAVGHALGRASSIRAIASSAGVGREVAELKRLADTAQDLASRISRLGGESQDPEPGAEALRLLRHLQTALRRIDDLVQGGLVVRVPDPRDRRRTHLELTPAGVTRMQLFLEGFSRIVRGMS